MVAAAPLSPVERERLLALIGVERWVLRGDADRGSDPGRDAVAEPSRPAPLAPQAAPVAVPRAARLAIVTGEAEPLAGRHAALLRHVLRTLAVDEPSVSWTRSEGVPVVAFGPGDPADAVLAPPLATLRASGAARRSLWPALRTLRRQLREGR